MNAVSGESGLAVKIAGAYLKRLLACLVDRLELF
jgi:hypothetical protein